MENEETVLKIVIPVEEEAAFIPEQTGPDVKQAVIQAGQRVIESSTDAAGRVWRSDTRRRATARLGRGTTKLAGKGSEIVSERIVKSAGRHARQTTSALASRVKSTDWKGESMTGTANGLRWLSRRLSLLAEKFTPAEPEHPSAKAVEQDGT